MINNKKILIKNIYYYLIIKINFINFKKFTNKN